MTYVRVDWDNGYYEYLPNDTDCGNGEFRNSFLLRNNYKYKRIRFLPELPKGKRCKKIYCRSIKEGIGNI